MDVSSSPSFTCIPKGGTHEVIRRSANYHPSTWGDCFTVSIPGTKKPDLEVETRITLLKNEVQTMLRDAASKPSLEEMILIDALQRLGVAYHFENEIEEAIMSIYNTHGKYESDVDDDLYVVALRFRLLRQKGFSVSCDVFKKFTDKNGEFNASFTDDVRAIPGLYEASHLRVQGEDVLEEALKFSSEHLNSMLAHLSSPLAEQVKHSLEIPFHKSMPRLEARHYISIYEADVTRIELLLELAKLDFNYLQTLHQREIGDISRWWKEIDFATKLPFARDRLVECYFWILGVYFEPKYSMIRSFMTKMIAIASVIDDIYDVYGTLEELKLFTDAIERWEVADAEDLPEYMKVCFLALLNVVREIEEKLAIEGRSYRLYYAKEAMKILVRAYFIEANWFHTGYMPTFEEFLGVSIRSSGYPMLVVQSLLGIGEAATKEAFDWAITIPKIVRSTALVARLIDDIHTYKDEQERGDSPSGVHCYMKDYGVSEQEACKKIKEMVEIAWKDINEEIQKPNRLDLQLLLPSLNLARMMEVLYQDGDGYTNSTGRTKERIASLLTDPIPM
uniref:Alpha, beta-caryophyllene synthase n=1 Tax=Liquidambar formosana TaxID=63359 RepID=A0A1L1WGC4_LIQFO|nr:TPS03 [Liquidambar formosana]AMD82311.1 alpha, beta-caryophyllene synthase [Liquidambar formosana]